LFELSYLFNFIGLSTTNEVLLMNHGGTKRFSSLLFVFLVVGAVGRDCRAQEVEPPTASRLTKSAYVLRRVSAMTRNGVPDAVLNKTKCLIVIPSAVRKQTKVGSLGVVTCREEDTWTTPSSVRFNGSGVHAGTADLMVFLMTERAVQALRAGELRIERQDAEAPLVKTSPIPQVEVRGGVFTYEFARGLLFSSKVTGSILSSSNTAQEQSKQSIAKTSKSYISAVISFVNTIIPTGIVLHHTAVIPGQEKPPKSERAVDQYHEERGFEILCSGRLYHVAYHYLVMANGAVRAGRPERCEGAHASGYNSYLGISIVGDFSSRDNPAGARGPEKPTRAQIAALVRLCRRLRARYRIPLQNIIRHRDIANTECPGDRFPYRAILDQLKTTKIGG
jgi:N-acetylmuramoyl-L-alanine amidase